MSVLIAGSTGLVGTALVKAFKDTGYEVLGINRKVLDLNDSKATKDFVNKHKFRFLTFG